MPYLATAQEWLSQSSLLLKARPTTTQISTKYNIKHPVDPSAPPKKPRKTKALTSGSNEAASESPTPATIAAHSEPIRASLTLKTYDPSSGTTLKYKTTKQAEVSRLIQILGRLARGMSGLPEVKEEDVIATGEGAGDGPGGSGVATPVPEAAGKGAQGGQGGKKKKKGKK